MKKLFLFALSLSMLLGFTACNSETTTEVQENVEVQQQEIEEDLLEQIEGEESESDAKKESEEEAPQN